MLPNFYAIEQRNKWIREKRALEKETLDQRWVLRDAEQGRRNTERARSWALRFRLQ